MKYYIVTGAPGTGKTAVLHELRARSWPVIGEAATDVIAREQERGVAEPWNASGFIDKVVALQRERQQDTLTNGVGTLLCDRSPWCTLALARFLNLPISPALNDEIERARHQNLYEPTAFFVRPLGFIEPSPARRISYQDSLDFEAVHEFAYREHGFHLVDVPAAEIAERASLIEEHLKPNTVQ